MVWMRKSDRLKMLFFFFCFAYFKERRTSFFKNFFFCKYLQDNLLYILSKKLLILLSTSRYALFSNKRLMLDEMLKWKVSIFFDSKLFEYKEAFFFRTISFCATYFIFPLMNEWEWTPTYFIHFFAYYYKSLANEVFLLELFIKHKLANL